MHASVGVESTGQHVWPAGQANGSAAQLAPASGAGAGWTVGEQWTLAAARGTRSVASGARRANRRSQKWDRDLFQRKVVNRRGGLTSGSRAS